MHGETVKLLLYQFCINCNNKHKNVKCTRMVLYWTSCTNDKSGTPCNI